MTGAGYAQCCAPAGELRTKCDEPPSNRDEALELLMAADGDCLDLAVEAVKRHAANDLAAAYLVRGDRKKDPVDYLRALEIAEGFNRALAEEKLFLNKVATASWDDVVKQGERGWADEARMRRGRLVNQPDALDLWSDEKIEAARSRRDRAALTAIAKAFPADAMRYFEKSDVLDLAASAPFADALHAAGEPYARAIVDAIPKTKDRKALEEGARLFRAAKRLDEQRDFPGATPLYAEAVALLERAGNPLGLSARHGLALCQYIDPNAMLATLEPVKTNDHLRDISHRIRIMRGAARDFGSDYFDARDLYTHVLSSRDANQTTRVEALNRRSANYTSIGRTDLAMRDSWEAIGRLRFVPSVKERHLAYGTAADAANALHFPRMALQYQHAAVDDIRRVLAARPGVRERAKHNLAVALRKRAEIHVALEQPDAADADLQEAADVAASLGNEALLSLLRMRLYEVRGGNALLQKKPVEAEKMFTAAIELAAEQDSTYRAVLHFDRAAARQMMGAASADEDVAAALRILRAEAAQLRGTAGRGLYEELWGTYFARFAKKHHALVQSRIAAGDIAGAFLHAEQARAFEPMHLLLQSRAVPQGFRKLDTLNDLQRERATLPADTAILQYLVLPDETYTWILTRDGIDLVRQRPGQKGTEEWGAAIRTTVATQTGQDFTRVMRAAYDALFQRPLAASGASRTRIVIVPDGPLHGFPFNGLQSKAEGFLIERKTISVAGSTSLYLYGLARDREFASMNHPPTVLAVGDPAIDQRSGLKRLPHAAAEARELARIYPAVEVVTGRDATIKRFLAAAKKSTIIHFGGHGVVNAQRPWNSMLYLADGSLTAEKLMQELTELERARLIVLGACETAAGQPVGPEGLAPLVRPLIAANVPAVVGTLWKVHDATAADLLVSLHCHYRHGDDVAVALRHAQLERLQKKEPAWMWASYQVVGYAASPYARPQEETRSEHVCSEDSLHRPDGLHSQ